MLEVRLGSTARERTISAHVYALDVYVKTKWPERKERTEKGRRSGRAIGHPFL